MHTVWSLHDTTSLTMEELSNLDQQEEMRCDSCLNYEHNSILGHFQCSAHRDCAGELGWNPENCGVCLQFREDYSTMNTEERNNALKSLKWMLKRMQKNFAKKDFTWEFLNIRDNFLGEDVTSDKSSISSCTPASVLSVDNSEAILDLENKEENSGKEGSILGLVQQMFSGFTKISSELSENVRILSEQNKVLLKGRDKHISRREEFESNKRSHSNSSIGSASSLSHDFKRNKCYSDQSPCQEEIIGSQNVDIPKAVLNSFIEGDYTFNILSEEHRREGSRIWIGGKLKEVIMHPSGKAFRVIKSSDINDSPFMSTIQAHDALVNYFHASEVSSDKLGPDNRSFRLHFDDKSGLAHALRIIKDNTPKTLHTLFRGDIQNISKCLPTSSFNAVSMVHFSTGWKLTQDSEFSKWAKNEHLDLDQVSSILRLPYIPHVPVKYLNDEKVARAKLIECISGISMLEQTTKEIEDEVLSNTLKAIAKHFLSSLKDSALNWISAKFTVRQIILQFSSSSAALDLLRSDVWEASVFDSNMIKDILKKNTQNLTFKELLNVHDSTNSSFKNKPKLCDPMNRPNQEKSRSPGKKSSRPFYNTNYKSSNLRNQTFGNHQNYGNYKAPTQVNNYRREDYNKFKKPSIAERKFNSAQNQKKGTTSKFQKPSGSFRGPKQN